jgi:iron-sulfur cluster assembly accessory protein
MSEAATDSTVELTDKAARRIVEIMGGEAPGSILRVGVEGGGCSGFQYTYDVIQQSEPDDLLLQKSGATVVIDPVSLDFLRGCQIDFVDDLMGRAFKISNPAATGSCGCGASFAV